LDFILSELLFITHLTSSRERKRNTAGERQKHRVKGVGHRET